MIKRISILIPVLSVISIALLLYFAPPSEDEDCKKTDGYTVEVFECNRGWGYKINKSGKVVVYQPYIPCVEGEKSFPDEESAMSTANLVLSKIRNRENPSVTVEELKTVLNVNDQSL